MYFNEPPVTLEAQFQTLSNRMAMFHVLRGMARIFGIFRVSGHFPE